MKRLLLAIMVCALAASVVFADQRVTTYGVPIRPGNNLDTLLAEGTAADQVSFVDSTLNEPDDYWIGATIIVTQDNSSLTDSTRVITDWVQSTHTFTFSAFASDSIEDNDSLTITFPTGHPRIKYVNGLVLIQATIDTSEEYTIVPGATLTSYFTISHPSGHDSVDTKVVMEVAVDGTTPNGASEWFRVDSISVPSDSDIMFYKAWGVVQANRIRFIFDALADFDDNGYATHYGKVMSDK